MLHQVCQSSWYALSFNSALFFLQWHDEIALCRWLELLRISLKLCRWVNLDQVLFWILFFDNFVLSNELIIRIDHCKELLKLAFWAELMEELYMGFVWFIYKKMELRYRWEHGNVKKESRFEGHLKAADHHMLLRTIWEIKSV